VIFRADIKSRLRAEKESLEACLRPPSLPPSHAPDNQRIPSKIDRSLLSEAAATTLESIVAARNPTSTDTLTRRVNEILEAIGPTIDQFADGVHRIGQYRTAADGVSSRVLAICAEKLTDREKEGRKKALAQEDTPAKDLASVLRSLSRTDQ
jgi:kinetochore protein Mis13/DSN1